MLRAVLATSCLVFLASLASAPSRAMCGGMVPRAVGPTTTASRARITNEASKVILHRAGERTTMIVSNDVDAEASSFALFIPVPVVVDKRAVQVVDASVFTALERASAPRATTLHEEDPCVDHRRFGAGRGQAMTESMSAASASAAPESDADVSRVEVKSEFAVGPFHIVVLDASQSRALVTWLRDAGYQVPDAAQPIIDSYIKQGMYFFVAEADGKSLKRSGRAFLPPLKVTFSTPRFGLPIRLGMINAAGPQELLVLALADGRVEATNYRTVKADTEKEVPGFVGRRVSETYQAAFMHATAREDMRAIFTEYVGASDGGGVLPRASLVRVTFGRRVIPETIAPRVKKAFEQCVHDAEGQGAYVVQNGVARSAGWRDPGVAACATRALREDGAEPMRGFADVEVSVARPLTLTRLHFRYDEDRFPEDLTLQVTGDRKPFRVIYRARAPFRGPARCAAGARYLEASQAKLENELSAYATLTGASLDDARAWAATP